MCVCVCVCVCVCECVHDTCMTHMGTDDVKKSISTYDFNYQFVFLSYVAGICL